MGNKFVPTNWSPLTGESSFVRSVGFVSLRPLMRGAFLLILLLGSVHAENVRVVSLAPSLTEIIYAIGAGDCLVGRCSACQYPAAVTNVPVTGDFGVPALEAIVVCKPQFVLTVDLAEPNSTRALEHLGIRDRAFPAGRLTTFRAPFALLATCCITNPLPKNWPAHLPRNWPLCARNPAHGRVSSSKSGAIL